MLYVVCCIDRDFLLSFMSNANVLFVLFQFNLHKIIEICNAIFIELFLYFCEW